MTARHFVVWVDGERTHLASRHAFRRGEAGWRYDQKNTVPEQLVDELGWWDWQTPVNGPFPAFGSAALGSVVAWLLNDGCTVRVLDGPDGATRETALNAATEDG